jgi:hypothetical protein
MIIQGLRKKDDLPAVENLAITNATVKRPGDPWADLGPLPNNVYRIHQM